MIPICKNTVIKSGEFVLTKLFLYGEQDVCAFTKIYLRYFIPAETEIVDQQQANIIFKVTSELSQGAYVLCIDDKCEIQYGDMEGIRNALATLIQLLEFKDNAYVLPCQTIKDRPDCLHRGVMIDLARGLPNRERLEEDLKRLSLAKCNQIHFHLMDGEGICYQSDIFQYNREINSTQQYTKAYMRTLVAYCKDLGMEIIPEIEFPAHADSLTEKYPHFKCKTDRENQNGWTVCLGNEEVYSFFEQLIVEVCDIFPSKYIHIGGDEHAFDDIPSLNRSYYWEECICCRQKMQAVGIKDTRELFYYAVRRFAQMAEKYGRKIILWNDALDVSKPVHIPKNCVVQFWRVANKYRGPREGCSYLKLLEQGFQVICSPFEYCYIDLEEYANPEKVASFDYKNYEESEKMSQNVIGGEVCAWEYGNPEYCHYNYSFTPSAILLLSKMWNGKDVIYNKAYRRSLTKMIFGMMTPKDYDVFELFGSIMPPRINTMKSYVSLENELMDIKILEKHLESLNDICFTYSDVYKSEMVTLIKEMMKK